MLNEAPKRRTRKRPERTTPVVIAYTRVSTEEQADSGAGLSAQTEAIKREIAHRGWTDVRWIEDAGYSAKDLERPGIQQAIGLLALGDADIIIVSKLDRLSRSLLDFSKLMEASKREGWSIVAMDTGVDTTTTNGRMITGVIAVLAEWERELISDRTRAALAIRRAQGVHLGRKFNIARAVHARILRQRKEGMTYQAIADQLNAEKVPTARGGARWRVSSVRASALASDERRGIGAMAKPSRSTR